MKCASCGTSTSDGDKFCRNCGAAIDVAVTTAATELPDGAVAVASPLKTTTPRSAARVIWSAASVLLFIMVSIALFGLYAAAVLSKTVDPQTYTSIAFGCGILGALVAKKFGRSGIVWFILSFIGLGALSAFAIGFLRAMGAQ